MHKTSTAGLVFLTYANSQLKFTSSWPERNLKSIHKAYKSNQCLVGKSAHDLAVVLLRLGTPRRSYIAITSLALKLRGKLGLGKLNRGGHRKEHCRGGTSKVEKVLPDCFDFSIKGRIATRGFSKYSMANIILPSSYLCILPLKTSKWFAIRSKF